MPSLVTRFPREELSLVQSQTELVKMVLPKPYLVNIQTQKRKYFAFSPLLERILVRRQEGENTIPA